MQAEQCPRSWAGGDSAGTKGAAVGRGAANSLYLAEDLTELSICLVPSLMGKLVALAVLPHSFVFFFFSVSATHPRK